MGEVGNHVELEEEEKRKKKMIRRRRRKFVWLCESKSSLLGAMMVLEEEHPLFLDALQKAPW
jgi:hypothetical protein